MEKLKQKITEKLLSQLEDIIDRSINEILEEDDISKEELLEKFNKQIDVKAKRRNSDEKKKTDGYAKLPQDFPEAKDWMNEIIKKRKETKLGDEKEDDKIFNVVTRRFIKRSSCLNRKDCTLKEINFEGKTIGFTEGGVSPKLKDAPQFVKFLTLFEKEPEDEEIGENDIEMIIEKLEEKPHTLVELKKFLALPKLKAAIETLKNENKIEEDGKFIKLVEKDVYDQTTEEEEEGVVDDIELIIQKLEERPYTLLELKKFLPLPNLKVAIETLKNEKKIEEDGKFIKLIMVEE
jgi:hypothetical protein